MTLQFIQSRRRVNSGCQVATSGGGGGSNGMGASSLHARRGDWWRIRTSSWRSKVSWSACRRWTRGCGWGNIGSSNSATDGRIEMILDGVVRSVLVHEKKNGVHEMTYLPGNNFARVDHLCPFVATNSRMILSSSTVQASFRTTGSRWLNHRSRHWRPVRLPNSAPISDHLFGPCSSTIWINLLSSWTILR